MIINSRVYKKKNDLKLLMMVSVLFVVKVCNIFCFSFFSVLIITKDLFIFCFGVLGVRKYSVGSMYNSDQSALYALCVWQLSLVSGCIFAYQNCRVFRDWVCCIVTSKVCLGGTQAYIVVLALGVLFFSFSTHSLCSFSISVSSLFLFCLKYSSPTPISTYPHINLPYS